MDINSWFEAICDDLDPLEQYPRPTLISKKHTDSCYWMATRTVVIDPLEPDLYFTLAHELRHWYQHMVGWMVGPLRLRKCGVFVVYSVVWQNERHEIIVATQKQYETELPWELDANLYATDAVARLLNNDFAAVS